MCLSYHQQERGDLLCLGNAVDTNKELETFEIGLDRLILRVKFTKDYWSREVSRGVTLAWLWLGDYLPGKMIYFGQCKYLSTWMRQWQELLAPEFTIVLVVQVSHSYLAQTQGYTIVLL